MNEHRIKDEPSDHASDRIEADLFTFVILFWRDRKLISMFLAIGFLLSAIYAFVAPEWYTARVVLSPSTEQESLPFQSQLAGLASIAGLDFNATNDHEAMAILTSREFTGRFLRDNDLLPVLFANEWNEEKESWNASDPNEQPDVRDGVDYFEDSIRSVREEASTGLVTLEISWKDPAMASAWANELVARINTETRNRAIDDSRSKIDYLRTELAQTNQLAIQQAISRVLEIELQKLLFAQGNEQFAFKVIDSAEIPKYKSRPQRMVIIASFTLFSLVVAFLFIIVRETYRHRWPNPAR